MNIRETFELLKQIALVDDRVTRADEEEQDAQARMWAGALIDVPLSFAGEAVGRHYAEHHWPVRPSDITARWRSACRDRMERHAETVAPGVDPDDVGGYRDALAGQRRAVVTGEQQPRQITGGSGFDAAPANAGYLAAKAAMFPPERETPAGPPERAVRCPTCGADPNRPCKTRARDRVMGNCHPDRKRDYDVAQQSAGAPVTTPSRRCAPL